AGRLATRAPGWWDLHRSQSAYLASAVRLDALVFAFSGDDFVRPDELRGVLDLPGARVVTLSSRSAGGCAGLDTHRGAFADCFEAIATGDVEAFIEDRL